MPSWKALLAFSGSPSTHSQKQPATIGVVCEPQPVTILPSLRTILLAVLTLLMRHFAQASAMCKRVPQRLALFNNWKRKQRNHPVCSNKEREYLFMVAATPP